MVFDEKAQVKKMSIRWWADIELWTFQEWKPRWGYKRTEDPKDDWVLEVPEDAGEVYLNDLVNSAWNLRRLRNNLALYKRHISRSQNDHLPIELVHL